jgi:hypothetical protein
MQLNFFLEDINFVATLEFPTVLWNPEVRYRVHKSPPLDHNLSQISPVHSTLIYLRFTLKLSTRLRLDFLVAFFPLAFPPISYMYLLPFMLHVLTLSPSLT